MPIQEPGVEAFQSQSVIVIHPGSLYLRIGKASDVAPHTMLHAVAWRRKPDGAKHIDTILQRSISVQTPREIEEARLQVSHTLQSCLQSNGTRRYPTTPQLVSGFNKRSKPEVIEAIGRQYIKPEKTCRVVFDDDILNLDPDLDFNIHFPWRRGDFNLHSGPGGSMTGVLADLEAIWNNAIVKKLEIPLSHLKHYKAVLIIPDIYNRAHLKELMRLLFKMGFGAAILVQDHVAATFGAGLGAACVVDVGDQKTSVSCVEDAISHSTTRVRLNFGGSDITQTFYWLLQKCAFPYHDCNPTDKLDAMLLHLVKEKFCHVDLDVCGPKEKKFVVNRPNCHVLQYTIQLGDEAVVAPLSLFTPELFGTTSCRGIITQDRNTGDPEDPHDEHYLRETSRKRENQEPTADDQMDSGYLQGDDDIVVDNIEGGVSYNKEFVLPPQQILGLDQAILQSIERCPNEDVKRKMYGCILIVGGGMKFQGIERWLQNRITLQTPYIYRSEQVDIITNPKDTDPQITAWRGAAMLSGLETARELWIYPAEYEKWGVKILRERAAFMW